MEWNKSISKRIRHFRELKGISQEVLAKLLCRSVNYVKMLESGSCQIGVLHVIRFCGVMNIEPNDFYDIEIN